MAYNPIPTITGVPEDGQEGVVIKSAPQHVSRIGFTKVVSNGVDTEWGALVGSIGSGMGVNQTGGNLVITSGTTARSETIIRSDASWKGGVRMRVRSFLSQRIANNNFFAELVDVIGDGLTYSIGSATAITVTIPSNPFTTDNVGQSMYIGGFSGTGTFLSGRYPIASVSGNDVTFTVSAFAVGTGTCSLFGWNYYQLLYSGTTVTNALFDTQRKGYATGFGSPATINTTNTPGHIAIVTGNDLESAFSDKLVASVAGTANELIRATRSENVPDDATLRMQLRIVNGSTAPASNTTWTVGFISVSNYAAQDISIRDVRTSSTSPLPMELLRSISLAISSLPTLATVTTVGTVSSSTPVTPTVTNGTINSGASTNATLIKATAGTLWSIVITNINASARYVKLYNLTVAPTVGTSTPVLTIAVPPNGTIQVDGGANGLRFSTGISLAITGLGPDSDTTAVTALETKVILNYT
jgi:hypothetical protein